MNQESIQIIALMLFALALTVCNSIRSCFLAEAFSRRDFSGSWYGALEGSLFIGYLITYLVRVTEMMMRKINNLRILLMMNMLGLAVVSLSQGLAYLIRDNVVMMALSFVLRIVHGACAFSCNLVQVDFAHAIFPEKFDFVNGLGFLGNFVGQGLAGSIGCLLYDNFGYMVPFIFSSGLATGVAGFIFLTVPAKPTHLCKDDKVSLNAAPKTNSRYSKLLVFPMIATMLVNSNYGIIQVNLPPFLNEDFGKSLTYGGTVLIFASLGMAAGSFIGGLALQRETLNRYTLMILGALLVLAGQLITFPPEFIGPLFNLAPYLSYIGTLLAGLGDPLLTLATLRAMYSLQEGVMGPSSASLETFISGMWLTGFMSLYYSGPFVGGFLTDHFSYSNSALILGSMCAVSASISLALRLFAPVYDKEKTPLLINRSKEQETNLN